MAEEWQGVLLIDEADVYLQQRSGNNTLEKETIVAGKPHDSNLKIVFALTWRQKCSFVLWSTTGVSCFSHLTV